MKFTNHKNLQILYDWS